eukprot:9500702-Pyramimonas_sp.AAC.1
MSQAKQGIISLRASQAKRARLICVVIWWLKVPRFPRVSQGKTQADATERQGSEYRGCLCRASSTWMRCPR